MNESGLQTILILILTHFVADFLCQTDKMALNKSHSFKWLSLHVLTYTLVLGISVALFFYSEGLEFIWKYTLANGFLHLVTDFFTSKATSRLYKLESKHWFFVMVGADQMIHYCCLFSTFYYIFNP